MSKLIASFEEVYVWLEVKSVLLIWKQKEGAGFQNWHVDLAKNGQTVYTICVNIGLLDIRADSGEIDCINLMTMHMHLALMLMMKRQRNHLLVTANARMSKRLLVTKKVLQSLHLL